MSEDSNLCHSLKSKTKNLCKNLPKSMIKYINLQTMLCPHCKIHGMNVRCSKNHLETVHHINIESTQEIIRQIHELTKNNKEEKDNKKAKDRCTKLEIAK